MFSYSVGLLLVVVFLSAPLRLDGSLLQDTVAPLLASLNTAVDPLFKLVGPVYLPGKRDKDMYAEPTKFIEGRGFKTETHYVTTQDGYILTMFRIVNPFANPKKGEPVLLQHGLMGSCFDFMMGSPGGDARTPSDPRAINGQPIGNNLAFELSNYGYDVWLMNSRGNFLSVNHTFLDPRETEFWKFTAVEMAYYDTPAVLTFIRQNTQRKTVAYVGHSQGTLIMFLLLAGYPAYSEIVKPFIALAPGTGYTVPKAGFEAVTFPGGAEAFRSLPGPFLVKRRTNLIPELFNLAPGGQQGLWLNGASKSKQLNATRIGLYLSFDPAGTSTWNYALYGQVISKKVKGNYYFDYGEKGNYIRYGRPDPPQVFLENINSTNIALLYSKGDSITTFEGVQETKSHLRVPLLMDYVVPLDDWEHIDFVVGLEAGKYINPKVIEALLLAAEKGRYRNLPGK